MRAGDFSEFATLDLRSRHRHRREPARARRSRTTSSRRDRINPVAARLRGALSRCRTGPGLEDNYFTNQLRPYDYNAVMGRVDHNFNSREPAVRRPATGTSARRTATTGRRTRQRDGDGVINGFAVTAGLRLPHQHRRDRSATPSTLSPTLLFDVRGERRAVRRVARSGRRRSIRPRSGSRRRRCS